MSLARSNNEAASGNRSTIERPIPTCCAPWPGNRKAILLTRLARQKKRIEKSALWKPRVSESSKRHDVESWARPPGATQSGTDDRHHLWCPANLFAPEPRQLIVNHRSGHHETSTASPMKPPRSQQADCGKCCGYAPSCAASCSTICELMPWFLSEVANFNALQIDRESLDPWQIMLIPSIPSNGAPPNSEYW